MSQAENEKLKKVEIKIRKVAKKDLIEISKIEAGNILVNTLSREQIQKAFYNENCFMFKAVVNDEVVGFILLEQSDELNIDSIAVKKEFRNLGIATKLISKAEECAKKNKIKTISLEVGIKNITAFLLYGKLGFVKRRVRKSYYEDGTDCLEMIKKI